MNYNEINKEDYHFQTKRKKIRDDVDKEIRSENWKINLLTFFVTAILLFFLILTTLWLLNNYQVINADIEGAFFLFQPWIIIGMTIFFLLFAIYTWLNHYKFSKEREYHFANREEIDINRVPNFIIDKYKRLSGWGIFINWLFGFSLLIGGIALTFFLLLKDRENIEMLGLRITQTGGKSFPSYQEEIIFLAIYLGAIFFIFLINNIYVAKEKSRLTVLFDLKNKYHNWEEIYRYQKKIHIFCFCLFVLPLVILLVISKVGKKIFKK